MFEVKTRRSPGAYHTPGGSTQAQDKALSYTHLRNAVSNKEELPKQWKETTTGRKVIK
jgi:hypothetical protein